MAVERGWREEAYEFLNGRTLADRSALRLVPIARDLLDRQRVRSLKGRTPAWLYECGPKPWPDQIRAAVLILSTYYGREMEAKDVSGYEGEAPTYLMVTHDDGDTVWALGILAFQHFGRERLPFGDGHCFLFTWVHPLFRRKGLMQSAVKLAAADLGLFYCQTPISRGMREVLRKIGHPQADDLTGMEIHGRGYD